MAKRIKDVTRDFLKAVPLPVQTSSYTVISHESVMNYVFAELAAQGFSIVSEEYRCTHDGMIAQGIYKLSFNTDEEMSLMFAWSNSYNKQLKFKCVTGGYVHANQTVMLCGEIGSWTRKHTGTADADAIEMIKTQIANAAVYYNNLVADKEVMKQIQLTTKRQAEILGVLFAEYELLTTEQASIVRTQMDKPSFFYNGGKHTLWSFYNHVTVAFQQSHPKSWMEDQRMLHWFISNEFDLTTPATAAAMIEIVDPLENNYGEPENQTNLLVQLAEVTGDDSVLEPIHPAEQEIKECIDEVIAQYPVTESDAFIGMEEDEALMREAFMADIEAGEYEGDIIAEEVVQYTDPVGKLPADIQSRLDAFNAQRAAEVVEEEEIEPEVTLQVTDVNTIETQTVTTTDFEFDLGSDDDNEVTFDDDFL